MDSEHRRAGNVLGALIGLTIMVLGATLLQDQTGVIAAFGHLTFWPFVVITIGLVKLSHRRDDGRHEGGWWLLNEMRVLRFRDSWPLFLVAVRISMVWKELVGRRLQAHERVE
jgi:hypothetical protein